MTATEAKSRNDGRYHDGLSRPGPVIAASDSAVKVTTPRRNLRDDDQDRDDEDLPSATNHPPFWLSIQLMSVPLFAGFAFGICGILAAGSVEFTLRRFAEEADVNRAIFVVVPGLFSMLFAIVIYQNARVRVTRIAQSLSRGLLVALLTWGSFSALATWVWCSPNAYGHCYSNFLLISGVVGGGPMLLAALTAGALVGWLIKTQKFSWLME